MSYTKYEPIGFENGTLVSPGKVDLETGEITMPVYNGKAPINATNLNKMDEAIAYLYENGAGSGDTLPYGAIVEYDGDTVPTGYEEVEDTLLDYLFYKDGDIYEITNQCYTSGAITGSSKSVLFSIVVPKSLKNIGSITVNSLNIAIRLATGGYGVNGAIDTSLISAYKGADNVINFSINFDTAMEVTNNTPANVYIRTANITLNSTSSTSTTSEE